MTEEKKEMVSQEKQELQTTKEQTIPGKKYVPATDIVETSQELLVYMDMPGVNKDGIKIRLDKNVIGVEGEIDPTPYTDLKPAYTEYNIGHYKRHFELSNEIDQSKIEAKLDDGVLTLVLPKIPEKQPQLIQVN